MVEGKRDTRDWNDPSTASRCPFSLELPRFELLTMARLSVVSTWRDAYMHRNGLAWVEIFYLSFHNDFRPVTSHSNKHIHLTCLDSYIFSRIHHLSLGFPPSHRSWHAHRKKVYKVHFEDGENLSKHCKKLEDIEWVERINSVRLFLLSLTSHGESRSLQSLIKINKQTIN